MSYKVQRANRREHLSNIGLNPDDLEQWRYKWNNLICGSKGRNVICDLSFEQYTQLAVNAGINSPGQIGQKPGTYQMGRYGDQGDYILGNCRFILQSQNIEERGTNGGNASISTKLKGRDAFWVAKTKSKQFQVTSPDGVVYDGENLNQFCKDHGLVQGCMANVCRGVSRHHKGWIGRYV